LTKRALILSLELKVGKSKLVVKALFKHGKGAYDVDETTLSGPKIRR